MATSDRKRQSNQINARLSTGPRSPAGKAAVSTNAVRHGLLSQKLILPGESQQDFDEMLMGLQAEVRPVGMVEQVLVERIATTMWRQRRLVAAESAKLNLTLVENRGLLVKKVIAAARLDASDEALVADLLADTSGHAGVFSLMQELNDVSGQESLSTLRQRFPGIWSALQSEAGCDNENMATQQQLITAHATSYHGSVERWLSYLRTFQSKLCQAIEAIGWVRDSAALLPVSEPVARYQSALDNELFKALRALREAQSARLRSPVIDAGNG